MFSETLHEKEEQMESFPSNYPLDLDELIVSPILVVRMMKNIDDRLKGIIPEIPDFNATI